MTDEITETPIPVPAFDLDGFPVYILPDNQLDLIEDSGVNHYFILAATNEKRVNGTTEHNVETVKLLRVTKSPFGRAITEATPAMSGIKFGTGVSMTLDLPKIPYMLVEKMDSFFRSVHAKYATEAILMLVYDLNYKDSADPSLGWGAIAPKQENTGGFCDYDPPSIIDSLPDHVILAGSAHSHPEMSAFASETDHKDQAGWEGIHITYGWRKAIRGGATEYYVETIYANTKWSHTIEDLVEFAPKPTFTEEDLDDWVSQVSKKTYTHGSTSSHPKSQASLVSGTKTYTPGVSGGINDPSKILHRVQVKLPSNAPDPTKHVIIGQLEDLENADCPFCHSPLHAMEVHHLRCFSCYNYIAPSNLSVEDFNTARQSVGAKVLPDLDVDISDLPIVLWNGKQDTAATFTQDLRTGASKK